MQKVLLVDDDVELTDLLADFLRRERFDVTVCFDAHTGAQRALEDDVSIVVLDVMLPRMSGLDALRRIRASSRVPVLMLTGRGDPIDRIAGLELGADDYVQKPCTPGELVARLRAILRRTETIALATPEIRAGALTLWPASRTAMWSASALNLTGTEFNLLEVLARHAGTLVSREALSLEGFGRPLTAFDRRIDVHVSSIRQKLGLRGNGEPWIQAVRGQGYQLIVE